MKILVTGGNGFLASNIIRELIRRDFNIRTMVRQSSDMRSLKGVDCELFQGDITDVDDVLKAVKGSDVVIHAAAITSQSNPDYKHYAAVNVKGTRNLIKAAIKYDILKFVFVSTACAFKPGTKTNPGNEKTPAGYPFTSSGYALSKINAQKMVLEYSRSADIDAVVVNPAFMIGPYDARPSSGRILTMNYGKKLIFVPPGGKSFIHVRDAAAGICNAIKMGKKGECYLLANENLTFSEFYSKVKYVTSESSFQLKLFAPVVKTMGLIGDIGGRIGITTGLCSINCRMLCIGNYYSSGKALRELKLPQTSVEVAISDALQWFIENGYLVKELY